jgi:6-pyruvoyl tetrahydropterin synthase/QueD family protein
MYTLKLQTQFSSAHQLTHAYDKKCNDSLHGHNWKVLVIVESNKLIDSMVIDFTKIKEIVDKLDHKNL